MYLHRGADNRVRLFVPKLMIGEHAERDSASVPGLRSKEQPEDRAGRVTNVALSAAVALAIRFTNF
jgi:hypothetical protein